MNRPLIVLAAVSVVLLALLIACAPAVPTASPTAAAKVLPTAPPGAATAVATLPAGSPTPAAGTPTTAPGAATKPAGATVAPATPTPAPAAATKPAGGGVGPPQTATVLIGQISTLGDVLVDANGMTLYTWRNDAPGVSNCTGNCATNWPPLTVPSGTQPTAGSGVPGTLGTIQRSDGTTQVTWNNQPLYRYSQDVNPGDANGQGFANVWYVVQVSGAGATPVR